MSPVHDVRNQSELNFDIESILCFWALADRPPRSDQESEGDIVNRILLIAIALESMLLILALAVPTLAEEPSSPSALDRGREMQARVYKDLEADDPWQRMAQEEVFATIWTRPGLTLKQRRLTSLTVSAAVGSPLGISSHLHGCLESGDFTEDELWEWLIHFTHYAGYPKAAVAWFEYRKVLAERGSMEMPPSMQEEDSKTPPK